MLSMLSSFACAVMWSLSGLMPASVVFNTFVVFFVFRQPAAWPTSTYNQTCCVVWASALKTVNDFG